MLSIYIVLVVLGICVIIWLAGQVRSSALRLDKQIEKYREEGPPKDPFSELAALLDEDERSRPDSKNRRMKGFYDETK